MEGSYQWLVKKGRLGLSAQDNWVLIEVDTEGGSSCVLTRQDAVEVSAILTDLAGPIWERSDQSAPFTPSLVMLSESACRWSVENGDLMLFAVPGSGDVGLAFSGAGACSLSVPKVVEVVQILQWLATLDAGVPTPIDDKPPTVEGPPPAEAAPAPSAKPWWRFW